VNWQRHRANGIAPVFTTAKTTPANPENSICLEQQGRVLEIFIKVSP